jgi:hypothetical protein
MCFAIEKLKLCFASEKNERKKNEYNILEKLNDENSFACLWRKREEVACVG